MRCCRLLWLGLMLCFFSGVGMAAVPVPEPLQPWQEWALKDHPDIHCPFFFRAANQRQCQWPGALHLSATQGGLRFEQQWHLFMAGNVPLPGGEGFWPESLLVNAVSGLVVDNNGTPSVKLDAGTYQIAGVIPWSRIPDSLLLPDEIALIALQVNGAEVTRPNLDKDGRLWFTHREIKPEPEQESEDKLTVRVYRHLVDSIPFLMETRVDLEVAGKPREVVLGKLLFDRFVPRQMDSPLPARLDQDGRLRIQLRPGQWQIVLQAHHNGPLDKIFFETSDAGFWPEEEVWVFETRPELRQVRVEGVEGLDPSQTALPDQWKSWPAYHLRQGQAMTLVELRRGDPQPSPNQLTVSRDLWLDFAGEGFTARDHVQGTMNRGWRLQVDPRQQLGSLTLNGAPQVITLSVGKQGVEVRERRMQAAAQSRVLLKPGTHKQRLPAVGWEHDVDRLSATLHLPPGWRVLMAAGMERSSNTWVDSWNVWDVFIVLITVAAMLKLRGVLAAVITGFSLLLIYPEATEFLYLLLNVIAVLALLYVLPTGRLKKLISIYGTASALLLLLWLLGFMVEQARFGLYPQLEQPWNRMGSQTVMDGSYGMTQEEPMAPPAKTAMSESVAVMDRAVPKPKYRPAEDGLDQRDPNLAAQTGPGLPNWEWEQSYLQWSGPVTAGETITLWLLEPIENRILCWLRVLLSLAVLAVLFGLSKHGGMWQWSFLHGASLRGSSLKESVGRSASTSNAVLLFLAVLALPSIDDARADFPDQGLLKELAQQQLKQQDCTPTCLSIVKATINTEASRVTVIMTVNAQESVTWPLPDSQKQWHVDSVLLDGEPHSARLDTKGFSVFVPQGEHRLSISGNLESINAFQLTFGVRPHNVQIDSSDFVIRGLDNGRLLSNTIYFHPRDAVRQAVNTETSQLSPDPMAPFVTVERILRLGRNWYMETRVFRVAPQEGGISLEVPLVAGESVTSREVEVESGKAKVVLRPGENRLVWFSSLEKTSLLTLTAAQTANWVEHWQVEISPLWHLQYEGLAPVKEVVASGNWRPRWYPYPGESLSLNLSRPSALEGATKTIDQISQQWEPGLRESAGTLRLHVITSKGSEQRIELPQSARVKSVTVDNELRSVDELNPKLIIPINPGQHWVEVSWRQPLGIGWRNKSPQVNIEDDYVNHLLQVNVPRNRWVLFVGGPDMGPAILFWGVLLVLVLVSFLLGRFKALPLRSWHWVILMVGLCTGWVQSIVVVVLWFLLLHQRQQPWVQRLTRLQFNLLQVFIVLFSLVTLALLLAAVPNGLIGSPDMGITGNGSSQYTLNWFVDRGTGALQSAWFVSLPIWVYRVMMLIWSLWLVVYILRWLKWAWAAFTLDGHWRSKVVLERPDQS